MRDVRELHVLHHSSIHMQPGRQTAVVLGTQEEEEQQEEVVMLMAQGQEHHDIRHAQSRAR